MNKTYELAVRLIIQTCEIRFDYFSHAMPTAQQNIEIKDIALFNFGFCPKMNMNMNLSLGPMKILDTKILKIFKEDVQCKKFPLAGV